MARKLGFTGGKYLEPAIGSGYYVGLMPEDIAAKTNVTAVEMDSTSGAIAKSLYPAANVHITPFQDHPTPDNFFDLVATNVPFSGDIRILDPKYKSMRPTLHDYYFLRSVDTVKPGGLIMHVTSDGAMDKLDKRVRRHIDEHCEFVSAIRFPAGTHANAGTEVVTDMIILRKKNPSVGEASEETPQEAHPQKERFTGTTTDSLGRLYHWVDGVRVPAPRWDDIVEVPDPDGGEPIKINRYFAEHPEQMLGKLDRSGTMYTKGRKNLVKQDDYEEKLQAAIDRLPQDIMRVEQSAKTKPDERVMLQPGQSLMEGQLVVRDGAIYQHRNGALEPQKFDAATTPRVLGQIAIRDAARELLDLQRRGEDTEAARDKLNQLYDSFIGQYGSLNSPKNRSAIKGDSDYAFLLSLEHFNSKTKTATKADIFTKDTITPDRRVDSVSSVAEAVGVTLHEFGRVDIERIAALTSRSIEEVGDELVSQGLAYEHPGQGWQSAAEYLSGNTRKKLQEAKAAAAADPRYEPNVAALERSQPPDIAPEEIGVKLGSPWLPNEVIEQFAAETLGARPDQVKVRYVRESQEWQVSLDSMLEHRHSNREVWGVKNDNGEVRFDFESALHAALHGKQPVIRSAYEDENGNHPVLQEATAQAQQKTEELRAQFKDWIWSDAERTEKLARLYNDTQNNYVPRQFSGEHQTFPGMAAGRKLRKLQSDFVWRVVTTGKGFAAHEVGTGKTASMIAAAMELRRLGLAKKPTLACLKANIEQITAEALEWYPNARILSMASGGFDSASRKKTLNQIATGDYDLIIMTHENLEAMRMKPETVAKFIQEELDEIEDAISAAHASNDTKTAKSIVKKLEAKKLKVKEQLKDALNNAGKDEVFFEDSGIDQLFVDEAHHFKSLPCHSREQIKGVPTGRSERATDMLAKTRYLLDTNQGRGVVFATGTPIVNTMAELYTMQRYLQPDTLRERGLHHFDAWKDTYGETLANCEFKLNGNVEQTSRFSQFMNLPELRHLSSEFMDIQRVDKLFNPDGRPSIIRPTKYDHVVVSEEHDGIRNMMREIEDRAKALKGVRPIKGMDDNMLKVCNDARMGSIDMRLIDPEAEDHPESKANKAIDKIVELYHSHPGTTQCVFSDLGINPTKASGFSLFKDMQRKLVERGIPAEHIVDFSDDSLKDQKREAAQDQMKRGNIRIAFGSTKRLGTGTNVQKNLLAVHHLDIPYVPAALEQRDGRGHRSGNINDPTKPADQQQFHVYKYVQQGSADAMFWQILARKTGFINQYMLGSGEARTMEDINAEQLTPDEMIDLASGGSDAIDRIKTEQEVAKLQRAKLRHEADQVRIATAISQADDTRAQLRQSIESTRKDYEHIQANPEWRMDIGGRAFLERKDAAPVLEQAIQQATARISAMRSYEREPVRIGTYRGMDLYVRPGGMLLLEGPSGQQYESGQAIASLDYAARAMETRVKNAEQKLANYETDLTKMQQQIGPFRKHQELIAATERLTQLKNARAQRMSLQVGTEKVIGGQTYVLNQHHRWQRKDQQQAPQQAQQAQQAAAQPQQPQQQQPTNQAPAQPKPQPQPQPQAAPTSSRPAPPPLDPAIAAKAAEEGDSPEHAAARQHVSQHYLQHVALMWNHKAGKMVPLDAERQKGMFDGIDFSKPVLFGPPPTIPPPARLIQWQAPGGFRGSFFAPEGATPAELGIHDHAKAWSEPGQPVKPREQKVYATKNAKLDRVSYLMSTTAPTHDTWSIPGQSIPVSGGGIQYYIPTAQNPTMRVPDATKHTASDRANPAANQG